MSPIAPFKPLNRKPVTDLVCRTVNTFRGQMARVKSPHTEVWQLVGTYFENRTVNGRLSRAALDNLAQRIRTGRISILNVAEYPLELIEDLTRAMNYDGVFLAHLLLQNKNAGAIILARECIEKHPRSHGTAAITLLTTKCDESQKYRGNLVLEKIVKKAAIPEQLAARIISAITPKTFMGRGKRLVVTGGRFLTPEEEGAMGMDPTTGPRTWVDIKEKKMVDIYEYSPANVGYAYGLISSYPARQQEQILADLRGINPELAGLLQQRMGDKV